MPKFGPIKRKDLIHNLKQLGFEGPFPVGRALLATLLREARIERSEWEKL